MAFYDSGTICTYASVRDFLAAALKAAQFTNYAGVVLLIARTASDRSLLEQMYEHNVSIDDVTAEHLLVLTPSPTFRHPHATGSLMREASIDTLPDDYNERFIAWTAQEQLRAGSVAVVGPSTQAWEEHFWATNIKRTVHPIMKASKYQEIVTQSATETRKFFGIPESLVPCLVLLSLREKSVWVMALANDIEIYLILKEIVHQWESPLADNEPSPVTSSGHVEPSLNTAILSAAEKKFYVEQPSSTHIPNFEDWSVRTLRFGEDPLGTRESLG